jgi:F0F1-type ATP synthase assembly protein I
MALLTDGLFAALTLMAWGCFAIVPWRLRRGTRGGRRAWAVLAIPTLLLAFGLVAWTLRAHPDAALVVRVHSWTEGGKLARLAVLLVAALALVNLLLAFAWDKLDTLGWWLAAGFGLVAWSATAAVLEMLRMGEGPPNTVPQMVLAVLAHALFGLAAAEALAPGSGRPIFSLPAALAVGVYLWALPALVRATLLREGAGVTFGTAAMVFAATPWLPPRLRRPALVAATLLSGLAIGWATNTAASLAGLFSGSIEFQ